MPGESEGTARVWVFLNMLFKQRTPPVLPRLGCSLDDSLRNTARFHTLNSSKVGTSDTKRPIIPRSFDTCLGCNIYIIHRFLLEDIGEVKANFSSGKKSLESQSKGNDPD